MIRGSIVSLLMRFAFHTKLTRVPQTCDSDPNHFPYCRLHIRTIRFSCIGYCRHVLKASTHSSGGILAHFLYQIERLYNPHGSKCASIYRNAHRHHYTKSSPCFHTPRRDLHTHRKDSWRDHSKEVAFAFGHVIYFAFANCKTIELTSITLEPRNVGV
jgi:hypothetical protein